MCASVTERNRWRGVWPQVMVAVLGGVVSLLVAGAVSNYNRQQAQERFERHAERIEREVRQRFRLPVYGLQSAVGLHSGSSQLDLAEFRAFIIAQDLPRTFPGIRGMGLIERVAREKVQDYEARVRASDDPAFVLRELAPSTHETRYVIRYIEPLAENLAARGLDVGSEPRRRAAIERAIDSGEPTLTQPITLVQDGRRSPGFLLFDAVYRTPPGRTLQNAEERRVALDGVFYTAIVASELLGDVASLADGLVDVALYAGGQEGDLTQRVFFSGAAAVHTDAQVPADGHAFSQSRSIDLLGQPYRLQLSSTPAFDASAGGAVAPLTLLAGLLITSLLTYLVRVVTLGRDHAERLAEGMTQDLDRLAKVAQRTSNAVVITDVARRITWVNDAFEHITGFSAQEALGQVPGQLLQSSHTDPQVVARIRDALERAQPFQGEILNRHKSGRDYWLQLEIQPLRDRAGQLTGFMAIESDVTAQKDIERHLRDFSERMALAADSAGLGVWDIDMRSGERIWDSQMYRLFGVDPETSTETPLAIWRSRMHPEDSNRINQAMATALAGGRPFQAEFRVVHENGAVRHLRGAAHVIRDADGTPLRMIGLNHDITEQRVLEQELREQNALMRSILEALPCGMSVFDKNLDLVVSNAEYRRLLGFPDHLFERQPPRFENFIRFNAQRGEYGDGDIETQVAAIVERARGEIQAHRFERVRPGGIPLEIQGAPMPGGGFVTTYVDISERKAAELAIAQKEALLRGAIDAVNEAFVLFDPDDRLVFCNEKYRDLYKASAEAIVPGASFEDIIRFGAERGQYAQAVGRVDEWVAQRTAQHRAANVSLVQPLDDGRVVRVIERRMADGHTAGFRIDITDLVRATEAAEQASRSKSQFLANMSHELRTPMNAVLGMLALLRRSPLDARQADHAAKAEGAARSLLGLLNDILDFSKVEAGRMLLETRPFEVERLLRELGLVLAMNASGKPVDVLYDIDPALPSTLVGDALRLQQVLVNLGGNAIKFTAQGSVVVSVRLLAQQGDTASVAFSVRDTGIGIAPENQTKIFSVFTQAEADTTRRFGGTGLGLAISQRLVAMMGGELQVESVLGEGSLFHFSLPLAVVELAPMPQKAQQQHLLLVKHNPLARALLEKTLIGLGHTVVSFGDGQAALERLAQPLPGEHFDAVLMAAILPDLDAPTWCAQASERVAASGGTMPHCFVLADPGHEPTVTQGAITGWLARPVTPGALRDALRTREETEGLPRNTGNGPRLQGMRLLLAEDNRLNQQVARELLQDEGAQVTVVDDGAQAVHAVLPTEAGVTVDTPTPWDAVLMDLQMPVMDGLSATRRIREHWSAARLPIVAMTANATTADRLACLDAGMNEHVGKPFALDELVEVLWAVTGWATARGASSHATPSMSSTQPAGQDNTVPQLPAAVPPLAPEQSAQALAHASGVSLPAALDRLGGRVDIYTRTLRGFVQDAPAAMEALQAALQSGEASAVSARCHSLKGLASTLGLDALAQAAAAAERQATSPGGPAAAQALLPLWTQATQTAEALIHVLNQKTQPAAATPEAAPHEGEQPSLDGLKDRLQALLRLLRDADMAATDEMQALMPLAGSRPGAPADPRWHDLHEAVMALDFARAAPLCEALLNQA